MNPPKIVIMTVKGSETAITEYTGDDSREAVLAFVEQERQAGFAAAYRYTGSTDSTGMPMYREMGGADLRPIPTDAVTLAGE